MSVQPLNPVAVLVPEPGPHGAALRLLQGGALDGTSAGSLTDVSIAHSRTAGEPVALQRKLTCALQDPTAQYVVPSFFKSPAGPETAHLTVFSPSAGSVRHVDIPADAPKQSDLSLDMLALQHSQRYGRVPRGSADGDDTQQQEQRSPFAALCALPSGDLVTAQSDGTMRVWQLDPKLLQDSAKVWRRLFGIVREAPLRLELESDKNKEVGRPKHGKQDPTGEQHVGGNTWAGGSGGSDTAGLGGKGGPYRLDGGHDVHQVPQEQKDAVSDEVKREAREIAKAELKKRLEEIEMGDDENNMYEQYLGRVQKQITQLRLILEQAEAKNHEREWLRNQNQGDLDDNKLVDALTGEKLVYRRRGVATQQLGTPQRLPKRLHFVLDLSGSMYRFNGSDQRLERLMETALLMMEALEGFEHKYSYAMVGHSGDGPVVPLVEYGKPPKTRKERLKVLQRMFAHSQYCMSGDFTLEAVQHGVEDVVKAEADDYFVIAVSDANLARYGIRPESLADAMMADSKVNAYCIFLASLRDEISEIMPKMPAGHAFHCQDTSALPAMFRTIFTSSRMMS